MSDSRTPWPEPAANPHLVGHVEAERRLRTALAGGRLHHAWLLSGPEGVGKATLAFRFVRRLLARQAPGDRREIGDDDLHLPADHPVFRKVAAGSHPDLAVLRRGRDRRSGRPRAFITVDDVRGVLHFLSMTPAEGGWRAVIVDAADHMNPAAANALLKTLEEPPPRTVFLLISHAPGGLLPTIRSRCLHLPLRPLSTAQVREAMALLLKDAGSVDPSRFEAAARHAAGAPGRALALATGRAGELLDDLIDMLSAGGAPDPVRLDLMARELAAPAALADHRLFIAALGDWIRDQAVHAARHGHVQAARRWTGLETELRQRLREAETLNLDRGLVLQGILDRLVALAAASPTAVSSLA